MKRLIIILYLLTSVCFGRDLAFLISKDNWNAIPIAKKQQGKAILQACTGAPIPIGWTWGLRVKANTNKVWGYAVFSHGAWVLKQKEHINSNKINQIKAIWAGYGGVIRWTTNFWVDVDVAGLERIPTEIEVP